jgi:hypothetical protein
MSTKSIKRLVHPIVLTELEECGLPWSLEPGTKHNKLYIDGRFCDIMPLKITEPPRTNLKVRAHVRRFVREIKEARNAQAVSPTAPSASKARAA